MDLYTIYDLYCLQEIRDRISGKEADLLDRLIEDMEYAVYFPDAPEERDYLDLDLNPDSAYCYG